jgi:hypothetical protein
VLLSVAPSNAARISTRSSYTSGGIFGFLAISRMKADHSSLLPVIAFDTSSMPYPKPSMTAPKARELPPMSKPPSIPANVLASFSRNASSGDSPAWIAPSRESTFASSRFDSSAASYSAPTTSTVAKLAAPNAPGIWPTLLTRPPMAFDAPAPDCVTPIIPRRRLVSASPPDLSPLAIFGPK